MPVAQAGFAGVVAFRRRGETLGYRVIELAKSPKPAQRTG
jgi:hypothetical protein